MTAPGADAGNGITGLLRLFRANGALTRAEVGEQTGLARATVNQRIDQLVGVGLLTTGGPATVSRGRPATTFRFNPDRGTLLIADIGASGMRLARCDLAARVLERVEVPIAIGDGPDVVLSTVEEGLDDLLERSPHDLPVWGVGVSVPGPVEFERGRVVSPPIMTGWDGVEIPVRLAGRFSTAIFVDNDVNAMALGEQRSKHPDLGDLLFLKVGTGVGSGIVANHAVLRGARGAAGDIGHTWADATDVRNDRPLCQCGKVGCVEAYAGGWAIVRDLTAAGVQATTVDDVVSLVSQGNPLATSLVRDAGRILGSSLANAVSLLNPSVIVLGGQLSALAEHLLAGIRERIYARSLPLATRDLQILRSSLDGDAGVIGLAHGVADTVLASDLLVGRLTGA